MVPIFSFLLASKSSPTQIVSVIENILNITSNINIEILVSSFEEVKHPAIKWYQDNIRVGSIPAQNFLATQSKGEHLLCAVDDHIFDENLLKIPEYLSTSFQYKSFKITSITGDNGFEYFLPKGLPKYIISRFPVIHRSTLFDKLCGYFWNPLFKHHYADNYLSFYLGELGQPPEEITFTKMHQIYNTVDNTHDEYDKNLLYKLASNFTGKYYESDSSI